MNDNTQVVIIGIILFAVVASGIFAFGDTVGYKNGQIDAMTGNQVYCLNARYEWINGKPVDGLKCKVK